MPTMIEEAQEIVNGQRQEDYGDINESFTRIADLWTAYTGFTINKFDVAKMMMLLKISRAKQGNHRDSYVDIVGYVQCVEQLLHLDEAKHNFFHDTSKHTHK